MLTAERRRTVLAECLDAGATCWINADAGLDEVDITLARVVTGEPIIGRTERAELFDLLRLERSRVASVKVVFDQLTPREALVLGALTDGLTAEEIAVEQFVAVTTVRSQIRAVLQKLGVRSQLAAVAIADAHRELLPHQPHTGSDRRRTDARGRRGGPKYTARTA
jgi:DNA-binding NarL/FixJ family response regulator